MGMCAACGAFQVSTSFHRILDDLWPKGTACSRFLLRGLPAPILNFALVESHGGIAAERARLSMSAPPRKAAATSTNCRVG
jgi:hypothetical protein